jgi:hypothetical protein
MRRGKQQRKKQEWKRLKTIGDGAKKRTKRNDKSTAFPS